MDKVVDMVMHSCGRRLEEVFASPTSAGRHGAAGVGNGAEDGEFGVEVLLQRHDGGDVTAAIAVVRRRPDGDDIFVFKVVLWSN